MSAAFVTEGSDAREDFNAFYAVRARRICDDLDAAFRPVSTASVAESLGVQLRARVRADVVSDVVFKKKKNMN